MSAHREKLYRSMSEWLGAKQPKLRRFQTVAAITTIIAGLAIVAYL